MGVGTNVQLAGAEAGSYRELGQEAPCPAGDGRDTGTWKRIVEVARREAGLRRTIAQLLRANDDLQARRAELSAHSQRLVDSLEDERRALSREVHDQASQSLVALRLRLGQLRQDGDDPAARQAHIDELLGLVDGAMEDLHRIALNLRPASLDRYGLQPALGQYIDSFRRQTGLPVDFLVRGKTEERLPAEVETTLFRAAQEALTNAARHARAKRAGVILELEEGRAVIIVEDNGVGFDLDTALASGRLGLLGMRERAALLGGTVTIESAPARGTTVYVEIPRQH